METARRIALFLGLACAALWWSQTAVALDPGLDIGQYRHTAWRPREGFAKGQIWWIAQTADGYLWLAAQSSLLRFDGVRAVPWQPPPGVSLPAGDIRTLLGARDGTLWIGTTGGLASWKGGKVVTYPSINFNVAALAEGRDGALWVGGKVLAEETATSVARLCTVRGATTECHGEDGSLGPYVASIYEDVNGSIWVAGSDRVWRWAPGLPKVYEIPRGPIERYQSIAQAPTGAILVSSRAGVWQLVGDAFEPFSMPGVPGSLDGRNMLRDRDGGLWLGTISTGLMHIHAGRTDTYTRADGLSGDAVWGNVFEDHEGNVWVATRDGLDLFRDQAAVRYSEAQGVPATLGSVLAAADGTVWTTGGNALVQWRGTHFEPALTLGTSSASSLFQDRRGTLWLGSSSGLAYVNKGSLMYVDAVPRGYIDSVADDNHGNLWLAHRDAGLIRVSQDRKVDVVPWAKVDGRWAWRIAGDQHDGLWLGFYSGGIAHWVDGRIAKAYGAQDGLGKGHVYQVATMPDGTVWTATEGGLSRIKDDRIATLDSRSGLPCDSVFWTVDDADGARWICMACGLVRISRSDLNAWTAKVDNGERAPSVAVTVFDQQDGVSNFPRNDTFTPHATRSADGKLWFVVEDGLMMVDPRHLPVNKLPPPVQVEQVVADRETYGASSHLKLPPLVRDLEIQYTALSFVAPEKVQFKYKLEGRDRDWRDGGNRRRAVYTDLPPGNYRFRVIAASNSGVWNEQGASLDFSVAPAYWQTNWFRALVVIALLALVYTVYRLRVAQIARHFNATLDARVAERTRIARDLHDTLLQTFHGVLLRFQTAFDLLPGRPEEAKRTLGGAIAQTAEVITQGRQTVQGLRTSATEMNDLGNALRSLGEDLANESPGGAVLRVELQGPPRALHPIVRDEVFRIAAEALRNAFRHAHAEVVEVEIRYDERQLRLRVRDDGKGIDREVLSAEGKEGHFGLRGMRERAKLAGGELTVWSGSDAGTEIELTIPAAHAYVDRAPSRSWIGGKLLGPGQADDS